jgi:phage terminase small subunit
MPRKSVASLAFPSIFGAERLRAPAELTPDERALFVGIVADCKANHFQPSDTALLAAYVRTILTEREASIRLKEDGRVINGKPSPWIGIWTAANKSMLAFARALRLSPLGRGPNHPSRTSSSLPQRPLSVYETMALESDDANA